MKIERKYYISYTGYTIYTSGLPDIYSLSPQACGPWASGVGKALMLN